MSDVNLQSNVGSNDNQALVSDLKKLQGDCVTMLNSFYASQPIDDSQFIADYSAVKTLIASGQVVPTNANDFHTNSVTLGINETNFEYEVSNGYSTLADNYIENSIVPEIMQMMKDLQ